MQLERRDDGEYRIDVGSLELRVGHGFQAAVIVSHSGVGRTERREVYRDTDIAGGRRWPTSEQALAQALLLGSDAVTAERHRVAMVDEGTRREHV